MSNALPIKAIKDEVLNAWHSGGAIIGAPPGSGKTTQLPLWLLDATDRNAETLYLLIPKRMAVKLAASQLAANYGCALGETVGYALRQDRKTSKDTRLIVTTYGSFLRMLINDPDSISGATILFDEFHERSAEQDLCFALIQQYVTELDDSVKRIIMSATLNVDAIKQQTGLPIIESDGFSHPIDIQYGNVNRQDAREIAKEILNWSARTDDHVLVFCAGLREIRQLEQQLSSQNTLILHGNLNRAPDLSALEKSPSTIILATNIAESSVTLPRVHTVIDCGQERYAKTHPVTGITELKTRNISRASATQRAGRSGRLGPGKAIRLWSADQHESLIPHQPPEIQAIDLTNLVLKTQVWGSSLAELPWLERPNANRWQLSIEKLERWGAIKDGALTDHGIAMEKSGLEPWLAHLISLAEKQHCLVPASVLSAHISEGQSIDYDLTKPQNTKSFSDKIRKEAAHLLARFDQSLPESIVGLDEAFVVNALPDRIIRWKSKTSGQLISGTEVTNQSPTSAKWSLLLDGILQGKKILANATLEVSEASVFQCIKSQETIHFHPGSKPEFTLETRLGNLILSTQPCKPDAHQKQTAWLQHLKAVGEKAFGKHTKLASLKTRWLMAEKLDSAWIKWPLNDQWADSTEPFLEGVRSLSNVDPIQVLEHYAGYQSLKTLNQLCPTHWTAPSGRDVTLQYDPAQSNVFAELKLQEIFGLGVQPTVGGKHPIQLSLLAPNGRPVANVTDLSHFWTNVYPEVRKELRGRYAKHPWPEDPLAFTATSKTNRQLRNSAQ